jgi:hypothetical protein
MTSYDRLFPNQDNMPQGGFGNLIALPLQLTCRAKGNTLFLEASLEPWPDPWAILAAQRRMHPYEIERLIETVSNQGRILGVRMDPLEDGLEATSWERPPSGMARKPSIVGTVPATVRAILAKQIFVEKGGPQRLWSDQVRLEFSCNYDPAQKGFATSQVALAYVQACVSESLRYSHVAILAPNPLAKEDSLDLVLILRTLGDLFTQNLFEVWVPLLVC